MDSSPWTVPIIRWGVRVPVGCGTASEAGGLCPHRVDSWAEWLLSLRLRPTLQLRSTVLQECGFKVLECLASSEVKGMFRQPSLPVLSPSLLPSSGFLLHAHTFQHVHSEDSGGLHVYILWNGALRSCLLCLCGLESVGVQTKGLKCPGGCMSSKWQSVCAVLWPLRLH